MYGKEPFEYFAPLIQCAFSLYCRVLLLRFSRLECPSYRNVGEVAARNRRIVSFIVFIVAFRFQTSEPYYAVASCLFVERRFMVYTVEVKFRCCGWSIFKAFFTLRYLLLTFFIYCFFLSVLRSIFLITLFLQPCHGGDSHLSLNDPSSIPGQIIIH